MSRKPVSGKSRGVALLMTLSVMLLLSVALMKSFEGRTIEVRHLSNTMNKFRIETLGRSIFRGILIGIQKEGLVAVVKTAGDIPAGASIPVEDGFISNLKFRSLDHFYNLNHSFRGQQKENRKTVLTNLVQGIHETKRKKLEESGKEFEEIYLEDEIPLFISALIDWIDPDDDYDISTLNGEGGEDYSGEDLPVPFEVKNAELDYLEEIKLLPSFHRLQLSDKELKDNFRIGGSAQDEKIDINLATKEQIVTFLKLYEDIPGYTTVSSRRDEIADVIVTPKDGADKLKPKYTGGNSQVTFRNGPLNQELENAGIKLQGRELSLFSFRTQYLEIQFDVLMGKSRSTVRSVLLLNYSSRNNSDNKPSRFNIQSFSVL